MCVRKPAVAGQFYPGDRETLMKRIELYLKEAKVRKEKGKIYGIIAPHAGYDFSGPTAAYAFKQIEGEQYDTVIVIGPSHQLPFQGAAIYPDGYFNTPIGDVEINSDLAKRIVQKNNRITDATEPHLVEHSLEVEIPFLQTVLKNFRIVPICIGDQSFEFCEILSNAIVSAIQESQEKTLILASSDFYHGYDYDECKKSLAESVFLISGYNVENFHRTFREQGSACGGGCIVVCMLACKKLGAKHAVLMHSTNSGDVTGMMGGYIVGYASFILTNPKEGLLSQEEKEILLKIARDSITAASSQKTPRLPKSPESPKLTQKRGCFVTIKKYGELRGCIGYVLPVKPLYQAVQEMAVEAALRDPRFPPVTIDELPDLTLEISALTPLQLVKSIDEIQVGRDGLYIKKKMSSGLLLPQVAVEEGWDRNQFLEHTCWKAGLPKDAWKDAEIYKFQAEIFSDES